ncbi:MAG: HAD family hydrolase [Planctomycetes bacterium]|nr:HAD family hydrolase [Planctomycetota bacterium]
MQPPILFDAVVFDLDGTLVATERFWIAAADRGARRALAELGLTRALPTPAEWLSMVGSPLAQGFERVFAELSASQRARVMELCVEEEHVALRAGGAAPMPGALETLAALHGQGLKLGIASNCSREYLETMLGGLGLERWIDAARCLESRGVASKADMIAQLLEVFGTRAAVMVGDRASDAAAAHANAIPHVHLANGFAPRDEHVRAEAVLGDLHALTPLLQRRAQWIERALRELGMFERRGRAPTLGVTGRPGAGKTLFARDALRVLGAHGVEAVALSLAGCSHSAGERSARGAEAAASASELERFAAGVLGPRARGANIAAGPWGPAVPASSALVLEGCLPADPRLAQALTAVVELSVSQPTALARLAARAGRSGAPCDDSPFVTDARGGRALPEQTPRLVLPAENPLGG